jgi:FtsZ-interacting cell division protein YlmF
MVDGLIKRAKAFIGLEEADNTIEEITREEMNVETVLRQKKNKNNNSAEYEIAIHEPKVYEDSLNISTQLRSGSPVIINLKHLDPTEGMRLIDFVCGTAYAIDGHMIKIGESIFLFTPSNIVISDLEDRGSIEESIIAEERSLFGRR